MTRKVSIVALGMLLICGAIRADSLPLTPLELTGYNRDIIWGPDGGAGGGRAYGISNGSYALYVEGTLCKEGTTPPNPGLPTGNFASTTDSTHLYRFAPAGGDDLLNNALQLFFKDNQSGTLTLTTAARYDQIGVLAHVVNTNTYRDIGVTLNYTDNSSENLTVRIYKSNQSTQAAIQYWAGQSAYGSLDGLTSASSWASGYICEALIAVNPSKTLQSVTFTATYQEGDAGMNTRVLNVYGISGHVPEPASVSLLGTGMLGLLASRRGTK